jgi:hypothetical protein
VLCGTCGSETPNDSRFCRICGDSFTIASGTARRGRGATNSQQTTVVILVIVAALLGFACYAYSTHRAAADRYALSTFDRVTKKPHNIALSNQSVNINQLGYSYFKLDVPANASSVVLQGNFTASGGAGNTIEAFVFSEADYVNWQNWHVTAPFYSSGKVTMGSMEINLPSGAGTYYLVFNNKFSLLSPKTVHLDAELTYYR